MRIGTFLEIIKIRRKCCLQVAICLMFLEKGNKILAKKLYICEKCNTSFHEVRPRSHFFSMAFDFKKGLHFFKKNCHEDTIIPEETALLLQKCNM